EAQVQPRPLILRDQRIGGLEDAVVQEFIALWSLEQQPVEQRGLERRADRLLCLAGQRAEEAHRELAVNASGELQELERALGDALELAQDQLDHIVGDLPGLDLRDVPLPGPPPRVEADELLLVERAEELHDEEWIAARLHPEQGGEPLR